MEIKFQIFEEENLLIQKFIGAFSIDSYMRYSQTIGKFPHADSIKKVLIDFRDLDFEGLTDDPFVTLDKVTAIRKNINKNEVKRKNIKHVFWVDRPMPTAIAQIFIGNFSELDYNYCTTSESLLKNLDLPEHLTDLEKIAASLENTF